MMLFSCFSPLVGGKKKKRRSKKYLDLNKGESNVKPRVKPIDLPNQPEVTLLPSLQKLTSNGNLNQADPAAADAAYEGGDEHDEIVAMKRDYSDLDLRDSNKEFVQFGHELLDDMSERDGDITPDLLMQSGHVSDPGLGRKAASWGSPVLKRSCSNIETKRRSLQTISSPTKSQSYADLNNQSSPLSARSNCSADRVMLKKRSSSQVLPSRSRKVWWKLFLLSHRNLHLPAAAFSKPPLPTLASHQKAGYSSDTLEPSRTPEKGKKKAAEESANQWVAFAMDSSSPMDRINAWVSSIEETELCSMHDNDDDREEKKGGFFFVNSPVVGESSGKNHSTHAGRRTTEETMQADHVIQSLNSLSSVAHISGMGLKVIPSISAFSSLRTINLSGNFIVQINPGSLPKSLHTLDLSRNKIATIEGLRGLTRLRVLNLSYNRLSRIGHGLSNCTLIKELYIAGNKISDVEGLHRLLKLSVLDLSFNKITTAKALGQLVANYHSLLALNLIGNPVQANIGDDQLRKTATSLLPHLTYLNKQPIKPQRAREAATDSLAKAALGSGSSGGRRTGRRTGQTSGGSALARRASQSSGLGSLGMVKSRSSDLIGHHKGSKHKSRGRHQHSTTTSKK